LNAAAVAQSPRAGIETIGSLSILTLNPMNQVEKVALVMYKIRPGIFRTW